MQNIILRRLRSDDDGTFGEIIMGDERLCVTCERQWKNNQNEVSCIPPGVYPVTRFLSPRNGDCFLLHDVPDRDMIEIHPANVMLELRGCIAPGRDFGHFNGWYMGQHYDLPGVTNSRSTMRMLLETLPKDKFTITIVGIQHPKGNV